VGIFKLFGKKPVRAETTNAEKPASKKTRSKSQNTVIGKIQDDEALTHSLTEKKHIARATERKIDAIEFEMSRDMGRPKSQQSKSSISDGLKRTEPNQFHTDFIATDFQSTVALSLPTTELLLGTTELHAPAIGQIESVPLLEEAAILFATGQVKVAEHMLRSAIDLDNLGSATPLAWFMLFDLYQIEQNQYAFESLSLDYAGKYETSPPVWRNSEVNLNVEETKLDGAIPTVSFPAQLDGEIIKLLQKLNTFSEKSKVLKLDFGRVKTVDPVGCGLLLRAMRNLKKTKHDLVVVAANNLTEQIRSILEVGRRDETEAPWLLLMEVLQLLQMKEAFEEASIDYCVTFEVSPPAFEAPTSKVTMAVAEPVEEAVEEPSDRFMMPKVIEGSTEALVQLIATHAKSHDLIILDCSQLERVEFGASAQLLNGLVPVSSTKGKSIQFHEVNYLVMHLFNAMGLKNIAIIVPRKQS
jgi:ABC-type transporter Mla MlaB component